MKRILSLLLCLLGFGLSASSQTVMWLDYCSGEYNSTAYALEEIGDVEVAIYIPADRLASLAGNEVSTLAMAFPATHPSKMTMWLRADRDGENLREIEVSRIVSKWNEYPLENPYVLTGEEQGLWVGASFTQTFATNKYMSIAGTTSQHGSYYHVVGEAWKDKTALQKGSFCIRMGVTGDNLPLHDMSISRLGVTDLTQPLGDDVAVQARITNHGADDVVNPIVRCSINGEAVADVTVQATIPQGTYKDVTVKVPTTSVAAPGVVTIQLEALWADGEPDRHPENNVDGINVGLVEALHDIALENVATTSRVYKMGSAINITGTIRNKHLKMVQNPQIVCTMNGGTPIKKSVSCKLYNGDTFDFSISLATTSIKEEGMVNLDLELVWRDGSVDDVIEDNKASLAVKMTSQEPNRRMVVEEGTGTWCGWCIRGIVGMRDMIAKYPDRFIGIAVHSGDEFQAATYINFLTNECGISGFPGCIINRDGQVRDPNYNTMNSYMNSMSQYADADVAVNAVLDGTSIDAEAIVTPGVDMKDANYRVVFVVTEDELPAKQSNYYAGGGSGVMGGFEKQPSSVVVPLADVARGIWPNTTGEGVPSVTLPKEMTEGTPYSIAMRIPSVTFSKSENLHVIALLLNGRTGEIANAGKFRFAAEGIDTVLAPEAAAPAYGLSGQRVNATAHGVVIKDGKKVLR